MYDQVRLNTINTQYGYMTSTYGLKHMLTINIQIDG